MKIDVLVCLLSQFPIIKAVKTGRTILRAIFSGAGLASAFGAFFCADLWTTYWDWRMCIATAGQSYQEASAEVMEAVIEDLEVLAGAGS